MDSLSITYHANTEIDYMLLQYESFRQLWDASNAWANEVGLETPRKEDNSTIMLAVLDNRVVGFIIFYSLEPANNKDLLLLSDFTDPEIYVSWIFIDEKYRGLGIGTKLLLNLQKSIAKLSKYRYITSYVDSSNASSIALHISCGFKAINKSCVQVPVSLKNKLIGFSWENK